MPDIYRDAFDPNSVSGSTINQLANPPLATTELPRKYSPLLMASGAVIQPQSPTNIGATPRGICIAGNGNIYVCASGTLNVHVINPITGNPINTIALVAAPQYCCYVPSINRVFVTTGSGSLIVIDPDFNQGLGGIVGTVTIGYTAGTNVPQGLAWCPTNNTVYVGYAGSAVTTITYINALTTTGGTVNTVAVGSTGIDPSFPSYIPSTDTVWIPCGNGPSIKVYSSAATPVLTATISTSVPTGPQWAVYCPLTDRVYVSCFTASVIGIFNANTNAWVSSVSMSSSRPQGIAYNPDNMLLYVPYDVSASGGGVSIFNVGTNTLNSFAPVITTSTTKPINAAYSPHTGMVFVTQSDSKVLMLT